MNTILLVVLAIVPGFAIALFIYRKDKRKHMSLGLLGQCIFYGVVSFFISIGIGLLLERFSHIEQDNIVHQMIRAVIFVGLVEEGSKFLFLRGILFRNPHFNQPFDGIVYSVMIGMGFATMENLMYILNGSGATAIIRMFTAVPAHAVFALIMGFFIGEAKIFRSSSMLYSFIALFFASLAHGYYDYFLFLDFVPGLWLQTFISLAIVVVITHFAFELRKDEIIDPDLYR